jgi:hypothetical protein
VLSQRLRKRIEEAFGWGKTIGLLRKTKLRGVCWVNLKCLLAFTGYNLVRMRTLLAEAPR